MNSQHRSFNINIKCVLCVEDLILCIQRRKLDAVYYYMRSLAASNPIMTARESLMSLFDEVRRKVSLIYISRWLIFFGFQRKYIAFCTF